MNGSGEPPGEPPPTMTRRSVLAGAGGAAVLPVIAKAAPARSKERVAVVGAGVFGAWTAEYLRQAGNSVTLVDAWGPAHSRASSGGESRMTRGVYGSDSIYTRMALDSLVAWKALSAQSGLPIFSPHGVLFFFDTEHPYLTDSLAVHRELKLSTETLTRAEMARRFPMIDFTGIEVGAFEPDFGGLMARRAVQTLVARFVQQGGQYVNGRVLAPGAARGPLSRIVLDSGEKIAADRYVFAAGPWLPKLFPDAVGSRIEPTRQEIFFFAPPGGDPLFQPGRMPGWADFNGGNLFYGFPDLEARGVKFAHDRHGPLVDPDTQSRQPSEAGLAEVVKYRDRRFPRLRGAPLTEARVCQYENSSNGDFLIDFHPVMDNVLIVGGGSGHGFKHGPEVGRYAASRLFGAGSVEPRFSLASKAETYNREVI